MNFTPIKNTLSTVTSFFILVTKKIFAKKSILIVTDRGIKTINFGLYSHLVFITLVICASSFASQAMRSTAIIESKNQEISRLSTLNGYYKDQFSEVNEKLTKIDNYLSPKKNSNQNSFKITPKFNHPRIVTEKIVSRSDQQVLSEIANYHQTLSAIKYKISNKIDNIETAISSTGLRLNSFAFYNKKTVNPSQEIEVSLNDKNSLGGKGGPLVEEISNNSTLQLNPVISQTDFTNEIDYLMALEQITQLLPLSRPIGNYHVSSGFGKRKDPITKRTANHVGLDFVGQHNARILSPSQGKVIFVGKLHGYGNAIEIDHGHNITSRYGHLDKIKVVKNQIVKKGDFIGIQGNTGRSTGAHLHYEIRYKDTPLNPKNFIQAGDALLSKN